MILYNFEVIFIFEVAFIFVVVFISDVVIIFEIVFSFEVVFIIKVVFIFLRSSWVWGLDDIKCALEMAKMYPKWLDTLQTFLYKLTITERQADKKETYRGIS